MQPPIFDHPLEGEGWKGGSTTRRRISAAQSDGYG
jgi:hypothetical protein